MVFGLLVRRSAEGGILPERHAGDFAQVGVVRDEPTFRIMGYANPDRHDIQYRLHLIDPTPQLLGQAPRTLLTLPQSLLVLQPFELGGRAGGEDAKRE